MSPTTGRVGTNIQSASLFKAEQALDFTCFGNLREPNVQTRGCPSIFFRLPSDRPRNIEAPYGLVLIKIEALERNREFRAPAGIRTPRAHIPNRVPVTIDLLAVLN